MDWNAFLAKLEIERPMYRDRCGNPIPMGRWMDLSDDYHYKVLRKTPVGGVWEVSTVWLGIDHGFMGPPLIFETMVFEIAETNGWFGPYHESIGDHQYRYSTETQAIDGHWATVREARKRFLPIPSERPTMPPA